MIQFCYLLFDYMLMAIPLDELPKVYRQFLSMISHDISSLMQHWESLPRKYSSNSSEIATGRKLLR